MILLAVSPAVAQDLLPGEFGGIEFGRQLIEPDRLPTLKEIRALVKKPQIGSMLLFKLYGDTNNHNLPIWSDDGQRLAFQRSDVRSQSNKLLLFESLAQDKPRLLTADAAAYDYMFRWGVNSSASFVFSRIDAKQGQTQVFFSPDGRTSSAKTAGGGRHLSPSLYQRTDGIWRLVHEADGQVLLESWNDQGPVEAALSLGRGTSPRWSRDGFRVLLARERQRGGKIGAVDVVLRNLKTETEQKLSPESTDQFRSPVWSPDEERVAFYARPTGENKPWRIHVAAVGKESALCSLGDQVVVNPDFESEGPSWEPSGRRIWFFSHAHRKQAYYPLVAADVENGKTEVVDYSSRCTTPNDLAVHPLTKIPEIVFVAHEGLTQDLFVLFLNHY